MFYVKIQGQPAPTIVSTPSDVDKLKGLFTVEGVVEIAAAAQPQIPASSTGPSLASELRDMLGVLRDTAKDAAQAAASDTKDKAKKGELKALNWATVMGKPKAVIPRADGTIVSGRAWFKDEMRRQGVETKGVSTAKAIAAAVVGALGGAALASKS